MLNYKYLSIFALFAIFACSLAAVSAADDANITDLELAVDNEDIMYDEVKNAINGGTFDDIQQAVDDASEGDTIELNGTFKSTGNEIRIEKSITIKGNQKTIIDANKKSGFFYFNGENKKFTLSGLTFINLNSNNEGILVEYTSSATYQITDCSFKNNNYCVIGNYAHSPGDITNCNFTNNQDKFSIVFAGNMNIKNCRFTGNTAGIEGSKLISDSYFENNKLSYHGYGGFISDANLIDNCVFKSNSGGANLIYNVKSVTNSRFNSNTLTASGLIYTSDKVSGSSFENNYLKKDENDFGGSCVYNTKSVTKCSFKNNKADIEGAAIGWSETVSGCSFEGNRAADGGAIYSVKSVSDCSFNNNYATYIGGAICDVESVSNCKFTNNKVYGKAKNYYMGGGAAICAVGNLKVTNCVFKNNKATTSGSAIYISLAPDKTKVIIKDSTFSGNSANGKFETVGYLFKNYANGIIYQMGDEDVKITLKNCKGLGKNTKNKFKMKTKIMASHKKKTLKIKVTDKIYSKALKGLKVKIKIGKKTFKKTTDKNGQIKLSTKKIASGKYKAKITFAGDNFKLKYSKTLKIKIKK